MNKLFPAAFLVLTLAGAAAAQSRTEDVRVTPPENWPLREVYGLELRLGASYDEGNTSHRGLSGGLDFNTTAANVHQFFVQARKDYAEYGGAVAVDKDRASLMYAYKFKDHWNVFATSTHARNKVLKLDYRTANGVGVCFHNFWRGVLDPVLLSFAVTPEYESFSDGAERAPVRGNLRLNFRRAATAHMSFGADMMYMPRLSRTSDYRLFGEAYAQFKITDNGLDLRLNLTDEYESRPRPGVKYNDLSTGTALVLKFGK